MLVADIMTGNPVTIDKYSTLFDALQTMEDISCHHLPVTGSEGHLIGIISDQDCRRALNWTSLWQERWREDKLAHRILVATVMTLAPIVIEPSAPAHEAARLMLTNHIRCLPVMSSETLVGIVTSSDILIAFMNMSRKDTYTNGVRYLKELPEISQD